MNTNTELQNLFGITLERCVKIDEFVNTQGNAVKNKLNELLMNKPINVNAPTIQFGADSIMFDELKLNPSSSYSCPTQIVVYGSFTMSFMVKTLVIPNVVVPSGEIKMSVSGNIGLAMLPTTNLSVIPSITTVIINNLVFSSQNDQDAQLANIVQLFNTTYSQPMLSEFTNYLKLNLIKASPLPQSTDVSSNMQMINNMNMSNMVDLSNAVYYNGAYYYGNRRPEAEFYNQYYNKYKKHYEYDSDSDSSDWDSDYGYYRSGRRHHRKRYYDRQLYRPKHGWGKYK
jgi:branched-subunit amino acid transport protein